MTPTTNVPATPPAPTGTLMTVKSLLDGLAPALHATLPRHIRIDDVFRVAMTCIQRNPQLKECTPVSLIGALIQCYRLGLDPAEPTHKVALIPFMNRKKNVLEATVIVEYRGLLELARTSEAVSTVEVRSVHAKDTFQYAFGLSPRLDHTPSNDLAPGDLTHVYAVVRFKDGASQFDVMTKAEVERIRSFAPGKNADAWTNHYEEQAKKTVLRRICKVLPVNAKTQEASLLDDRASLGMPQDLALLADPTETPTEIEAVPGPIVQPVPVADPPAGRWRQHPAPSLAVCEICLEKTPVGQPIWAHTVQPNLRCLTHPPEGVPHV